MTIEYPLAAHLPSLRSLWKEAFGDGEDFLDRFFGVAFAPDRARCVTDADGEAAAALYWLDATLEGKRIAYLYAIATRRAYRGRGLCRDLMRDVHALLRARGYAAALLVPSEPSLFDFYAKMGYAPCTPMQTVTAEAADGSLTLRRVCAEEYGELRRALLPPRAVGASREMLALLGEQEELYAGEELLLAAHREDGALVATELLGDPRRAGELLKFLGLTRGKFRVAGGETPFAAYLPLSEDAPDAPLHFSLAFD